MWPIPKKRMGPRRPPRPVEVYHKYKRSGCSDFFYYVAVTMVNAGATRLSKSPRKNIPLIRPRSLLRSSALCRFSRVDTTPKAFRYRARPEVFSTTDTAWASGNGCFDPYALNDGFDTDLDFSFLHALGGLHFPTVHPST